MTNGMTARKKFKIGDRVISKIMGKSAAGEPREIKGYRHGTIKGFIRGDLLRVKVLVDGESAASIWASALWTRDENPQKIFWKLGDLTWKITPLGNSIPADVTYHTDAPVTFDLGAKTENSESAFKGFNGQSASFLVKVPWYKRWLGYVEDFFA